MWRQILVLQTLLKNIVLVFEHAVFIEKSIDVSIRIDEDESGTTISED